MLLNCPRRVVHRAPEISELNDFKDPGYFSNSACSFEFMSTRLILKAVSMPVLESAGRTMNFSFNRFRLSIENYLNPTADWLSMV